MLTVNRTTVQYMELDTVLILWSVCRICNDNITVPDTFIDMFFSLFNTAYMIMLL